MPAIPLSRYDQIVEAFVELLEPGDDASKYIGLAVHWPESANDVFSTSPASDLNRETLLKKISEIIPTHFPPEHDFPSPSDDDYDFHHKLMRVYWHLRFSRQDGRLRRANLLLSLSTKDAELSSVVRAQYWPLARMKFYPDDTSEFALPAVTEEGDTSVQQTELQLDATTTVSASLSAASSGTIASHNSGSIQRSEVLRLLGLTDLLPNGSESNQ
jgi:hypothetical protein